MKTFFSLIFVVISAFSAVLPIAAQSDPVRVDSVFNHIQGDWYKIVEYQGFTGCYDTVYTNEMHHLVRIAGTDSVVWTITRNNVPVVERRLKLIYTDANIYRQYRWMFKNSREIYSIQQDMGLFWIVMAVTDGSGDGLSKSSQLPMKLSKVRQSLAFPNPVRTTLSVGAVSVVKIFDLTGRIVKSVNAPSNGLIDVSLLKQGVYVVQTEVDGKKATGRMVKR